MVDFRWFESEETSTEPGQVQSFSICSLNYKRLRTQPEDASKKNPVDARVSNPLGWPQPEDICDID
jgi:hypothetical protein